MDVFENRFCNESCALKGMARRHEAIRHFEMHLRTETGELVHVSVSVVVIPGPRPSQHTVVHLLPPVARQGAIPRAPHDGALEDPPVPPRLPPPAHALTDRELEVLRRLGNGSSTQEIADSLFISVTTVRNHVQNILRKLDVHSKLEAVSLALRHRLI